MKINKRLNILKGAAIFVLAVFLLIPALAIAHPGNTASDSCHYCRTNCDYWGVTWNQRHCHNGYRAPVPDPWVCKIGEQKFYSHVSANDFWNNQIKKIVDYWYSRILERQANQNDYNHWIANYPYNNCKGTNIDQSRVENELKNSEEKKQLEDRKISEIRAREHRDGIRDLYINILKREPSNEEIESQANIESDIKKIEAAMFVSEEYKNLQAKKASETGKSDWFWWLLGGGGSLYVRQLIYKKYKE